MNPTVFTNDSFGSVLFKLFQEQGMPVLSVEPVYFGVETVTTVLSIGLPLVYVNPTSGFFSPC